MYCIQGFGSDEVKTNEWVARGVLRYKAPIKSTCSLPLVANGGQLGGGVATC